MRISTLLFGLWTTTEFASGSTNSTCKCFPGAECWPSIEQFDALNDTVNGRLIATVPLAVDCHTPYFDNVTCSLLQSEWTDSLVQCVFRPAARWQHLLKTWPIRVARVWFHNCILLTAILEM